MSFILFLALPFCNNSWLNRTQAAHEAQVFSFYFIPISLLCIFRSFLGRWWMNGCVFWGQAMISFFSSGYPLQIAYEPEVICEYFHFSLFFRLFQLMRMNILKWVLWRVLWFLCRKGHIGWLHINHVLIMSAKILELQKALSSRRHLFISLDFYQRQVKYSTT